MNQCRTCRFNTKIWEYQNFILLGVTSKSTPNFTPKNSDTERYFVISWFLTNFTNSWYTDICVFCDILRNHKFESLSLRNLKKEVRFELLFLFYILNRQKYRKALCLIDKNSKNTALIRQKYPKNLYNTFIFIIFAEKRKYESSV